MKKIFVFCDLKECRKKAEIKYEQYPYTAGWIYLYKLELKLRSNKKYEVKDKHFCCLEHKIKFLLEDIQETLNKLKGGHNNK